MASSSGGAAFLFVAAPGGGGGGSAASLRAHQWLSHKLRWLTSTPSTKSLEGVACSKSPNKKKKGSSPSHFQFYVMGMFDSYLCFPCLFCAWLAGSIDVPQPQEGIDGGSLPPGTEYETRAGSSSLKDATLHSVHDTSA